MHILLKQRKKMNELINTEINKSSMRANYKEEKIIKSK